MTITLISALSLALVSCTKEKAGSGEPNTQSTAKPYPLEVCLVSDEKLGSMGEPVIIEHEGQQIKFCCDGCIPKFQKDPTKYLGKLTGK